MPAAGWALLHGVPLGLAGAVVVFAIWWTWWFRGTLPGRWALAVLLILKIAVALGAPIERGLEADYFANAQWAPPVEGSTDFRSRAFTRIDRRLDFGGPGPVFPVYFFNDAARFNFYRPGEPDREDLPFSVTWQGYVDAPRAEDRRQFYLRGTGVTAELWVDGAQTVHLDPAASDAFDRALWPAGIRHITVRLSVPAGAPRRFEAGYVDPDGKQIPFDAANIAARPYPRWRLFAGVVVRIVSRIIDVLLLVVLLGLFAWTLAGIVRAATTRRPGQDDAIFALSWVALMAGGLLFARSTMGRVVILGGGQEDLAYEWYAREILLNGPLVRLGSAAGQNAAFFHQSLYPYFLALVHLIFGEDLSGVYLIHWLLGGATVIAVWKISERLFGTQVGRAALALGVFYFAGKLAPMAGLLLPENLFMPLVALWTISMIRMAAAEAETADTIRAGLSGGLSALARSTSIVAWVFALPVLALSRRRAGKSVQAVFGMLAIMITVLGVAAIRNWMASGSLMPMAIDFGIGVQNFSQKARYALGLTNVVAPGEGTSPGLIATWTAALIGMAVMIWGRVADGLPGPVRLLPLAIAVSHFLVVTFLVPSERVIIPLYLLLLPYAGLGVIWSIDFLVPPEEE